MAGANNWGGWRPGGGRPKGSRSSPMGRVKPPKEVREAAIEAAKAELLSGKETALDIMERVMRGDTSITTEQFLGEGAGALSVSEAERSRRGRHTAGLAAHRRAARSAAG